MASWDSVFHDTVICSFIEDGGGIWKSSEAGRGWSAGNVETCSYLNNLSIFYNLITFLSIYCIWQNKLKHFNIVLFAYDTVRECLTQFEDLKVKFKSECHAKEKEVSLDFE